MLYDQVPSNSSNDLHRQLDIDFALKAAGLGIWEFDPTTNQIKWDDKCRELFGFPKDKVLSYDQVTKYIHPEDVDRVLEAVRRAVSEEPGETCDVTYRTLGADDGQLRWVRFVGRSYFTEAGDVYRFAGIAQEITPPVLTQQARTDEVHDRGQSEGQIKQAEVDNPANQDSWSWLNRIFEQAPVAIALLSGADYRIKLANATMYKIWQLPAEHESIIGQPVFTAFPNIAGIGLEDLLDQVRQTQQPVTGIEAPYASEGSPTAYVNFVYAPIIDETTEVSVVVIATDVSQQVETRQRLRESEERYRYLSEKLATSNEELAAVNEELASNNEELEESNSLLSHSNENLQRFAYVASHDLQEPLRKIQQFGDLLRAQHDGFTKAELDYLERMQSAASRMSILIRDLLSFSRISTHREASVPVALEDVMNSALTTLELTIEETEAAVIVGDLPTISGDASQLRQLFQNLLSNAIKFHRPGVAPVIKVDAKRVPANDLPISVKPIRSSRKYVQIDVTDNGIGFEEKYLDRIFEVFQRLHGRNEFSGTGIGLAICEKVVFNHGGAITAMSQPGQGATFSVYFPV
ncbi:ATP-binding protein [Spirosoma pomorum]